jgi:porphobilinogen deaminase
MTLLPSNLVSRAATQVKQADLNTKCPDVAMIHAGTKSIRHGISATVIMRDTTDLAECTIKQVPKTKIVISAVLYRRNISDCFVSITKKARMVMFCT